MNRGGKPGVHNHRLSSTFFAESLHVLFVRRRNDRRDIMSVDEAIAELASREHQFQRNLIDEKGAARKSTDTRIDVLTDQIASEKQERIDKIEKEAEALRMDLRSQRETLVFEFQKTADGVKAQASSKMDTVVPLVVELLLKGI